MTMAKGISGGYVPAGAVIVTDRIARHFDEQVLVCGLTSYAHPLVCEAFNAVLQTALKYRVDMRTAAYIVAISRVAVVTRMRGMYA